MAIVVVGQIPPPALPQAPGEYDKVYFDKLNNFLRIYFNQLNAIRQYNAARLNFDLDTLPTDADLPNLRLGDVYRDTVNNTQPEGQVLRVKTAIYDTVVASGVGGTGGVGTVTIVVTP
jgi:hypothetical protein